MTAPGDCRFYCRAETERTKRLDATGVPDIPVSMASASAPRQVLAEEIDTAENLTRTTETFNRGTRFTIIHEAHAWGTTQVAHCTVQVKEKLYNILGPVL